MTRRSARSRRGGGGAAPKPRNLVAPVISGTLAIGQTLTSTTGTWTGPGPVFTYQWKRGGVAIGGATASTHVQVAADIGLSITCEVTARNAGGSATAASNALEWTMATPGNLIAWYRGDQYATGTWTDKSAGGHNLTQATGGAQATAVTRWGQGAASFDGGDFSQGALGALQAQPLTIYSVFEIGSLAAARRIYDGDDTTNNPELDATTTPAWRLFAGTALTGGTPVINTLYGSCAVHDATGLLFINNFMTAGAVISGAEGARGIDGVTLGASSAGGNPLIGFIGEFALFAGAHAESVRQNVGAYLNNRYTGMAITIA